MTSKKESQLTTQADFTSGDLVTGLRNSQNVNFSYSGIYSSIFGTGSFNQVGDPLAAPILDQPAVGVNNFRNLEGGAGINTNISAQNGVVLSCNFSQPTTGHAVIENLNASQYKLKTMLAGSNMGITDTGDSLRFDVVTSEGSSSTVIVATIDDFPSPVDGVIYLEENKTYVQVNNITTALRFSTTGACSITATSSPIVKLTYTGTETLLTATNSDFKFRNIKLSAPSGALIDISNTGVTGAFEMSKTEVEDCKTIGTINNTFFLLLEDAAFNIQDNGVLFSGVMPIIAIRGGIITLGGGTFIDFGTVITNDVVISQQAVLNSSNPAATFMSGLADSGNVEVGGIVTAANNRVEDLTTPLVGITPFDTRYEFIGNSGIRDTIDNALMYVEGSTTETVISVAGTKVKINDVWTGGALSRFDFDSSGRLTYIGGKDAVLDIDITGTALAASGADKQASIAIAINGVVVTPTNTGMTINSSKAASFNTLWQGDFQAGDYVEVFVANDDDTVNVIVQQIIMRIS